MDIQDSAESAKNPNPSPFAPDETRGKKAAQAGRSPHPFNHIAAGHIVEPPGIGQFLLDPVGAIVFDAQLNSELGRTKSPSK